MIAIRVRDRKYAIWVRDGFRCIYCKTALHFDNITIDHVIPVRNGGSNRYDNIATSCRPCNRFKGHRTDVFLDEIEAWRRKNDYPLSRLGLMVSGEATTPEPEDEGPPISAWAIRPEEEFR